MKYNCLYVLLLISHNIKLHDIFLFISGPYFERLVGSPMNYSNANISSSQQPAENPNAAHVFLADISNKGQYIHLPFLCIRTFMCSRLAFWYPWHISSIFNRNSEGNDSVFLENLEEMFSQYNILYIIYVVGSMRVTRREKFIFAREIYMIFFMIYCDSH